MGLPRLLYRGLEFFERQDWSEPTPGYYRNGYGHRPSPNGHLNGHEEHKFNARDAAAQEEILRIPEELTSLIRTQIGIKRTEDYCRKPDVIRGELVKILEREKPGIYVRSKSDKRLIVGSVGGTERTLAMFVDDARGTYITFFEYPSMDHQEIIGKLNERLITQKEKELLAGMQALGLPKSP